MYLDGLDGLDQKIVGLLIENARISYSDIGERIGISRVAVKARIQALEQKGIIEEYTTVINPQKISGAVSCYFEIETTPSCLAEVTEILNQHDTVTQIYRVTGKDKLHVHAVAASAEEMEIFLHTVIDALPGVVSCSCNRDDTDGTLNSSFILGSADSGRQNCRAVMLCQLLVRFVENDLILPMLLHAGFQVVALDDPGDTAEVFVGIHMGSGDSWFMEKKASA